MREDTEGEKKGEKKGEDEGGKEKERGGGELSELEGRISELEATIRKQVLVSRCPLSAMQALCDAQYCPMHCPVSPMQWSVLPYVVTPRNIWYCVMKGPELCYASSQAEVLACCLNAMLPTSYAVCSTDIEDGATTLYSY